MFTSVVEVLKILRTIGELTKTMVQANTYVNLMQTFDFIHMLILIKTLLGIACELSQALPRKDQDIVNTMNLVKLCKHQLNSSRSTEDDMWDSFLGKVFVFCEENYIEVKEMNDAYQEQGRPRCRQRRKKCFIFDLKILTQ